VISAGFYIDTWREPGVTELPFGTQVVEETKNKVWEKRKQAGVEGWWSSNRDWVPGTVLAHRVKVTYLGGDVNPEFVVAPPGHTCPRIDDLKSILRKIEWWDKNRPNSEAHIHDLVRQAHATLEQVRSENSQLRSAYYAARKKCP
jgi:hypothetical protein